LVGACNSSSYSIITNSYYKITGQSEDPTKGTPKTLEQLRTQSTYTDWDFVSTWYINANINNGLPHLITGSFPALATLQTTYKEGLTLADIEFPSVGYQWIEPTTPISAGAGQEFDVIHMISKGKAIVNVAKATPLVPTGLTATYGASLSSVTLPTGWSWESTGTVGNAGAQTHKAKYTPTDIANYNVLTGVDVTITVSKATPTYTIPTGLAATYGASLSSVALPPNWSWESTGTVGNAGTQTHKAKFTPADIANYNAVSGINVTVTVSKATPTYTAPAGLTSTYGASLSSVALPSGWSWESTGDVGNAGAQAHKAKYTPADIANYNTVTNVDVTVTVSKASLACTAPTGLAATYGDPLSSVALPPEWSWEEGTETVGNAGAQTHKATFTPADAANYNSVPNVDVTVTVSQASGTFVTPEAISASYTPALTLETLPLANYTWNAPSTPLAAGDDQKFPAIYTDPSGNYTSATGEITVNVAKNPGSPAFVASPPIQASFAESLTLEGIPLPAGYSWSNPETSIASIGEREYETNYTDPNYSQPSSGKITVSVFKNPGTEPLFPPLAALTAAYEEGVLRLSSIALPSGYSWVEPSVFVYPGSSQKFDATYASNYENPIGGALTLNVSKNPGMEPAFPEISVNATFRSGLALADIALPSGYSWAEPATKISSPGNGLQFSATHSNSLYAQPSSGKITLNATAGIGVVSISSWIYGEKPGAPLTVTTTNGAATLSYTGKTNSGANYSSKSQPTEAGSYSITATFAAKGNYTEIVRTVAFTIGRAKGSGAVSIDGWKFGSATNNPVAGSETNGTGNVSYIFKSTDGISYAPQPSKPSNVGDYMLIAVFPQTNNYTEARDTTYFTISNSNAVELAVSWSADSVFTYNKTVQHPVPTVKDGGKEIPLIILNGQSEAGEYNGVQKAMAIIENEAARRNYILINNTKSYRINKKPLQTRFKVDNPSDDFDAKGDTVWVPGSIFSSPELLGGILAELVDYSGFATDAAKNESDDASVLSGAPRVEVAYEKSPVSQSVLYKRVETARRATATIVVDDVSAKNYTLVKNIAIVRETIEEADLAPQISCRKNLSCAPMSEASCLTVGGDVVSSCTMLCSVDNACAPMPVGSCAAMGGSVVAACPNYSPEPVLRPQIAIGAFRVWQNASGMVNVDLGYTPASPVALSIYDMKGKLAATELLGTRFANVRVNVPAGVYLFRAGSRVVRAAVL